jgi:autotransporter-associated beta strand protein
MKIKNQPTTLRRIIQGLLTLSLGIGTAQAVNYTKANTSTMSNATDWSPTSPWPPNAADTLTWQSSPISLANNLALSLGTDFNVLGLDLRPNGAANPSLKIASGNIINLGTGGLNQSNGAWNTTLDCGVNLVGAATFNIQGSMVFNGSITQDSTARRLTKGSTGALLLTGANSYANGTVISKGILSLSGSGTLGSTSATTGILQLNGGGEGTTLDLGATTQTVAGAVSFGGGEVRNGTLICNATGSALTGFGIISANLQGSGRLRLDNNNQLLVLSGTNSYSGGTEVQGGTVRATKPAALPNSGASGIITLNNNSSNANLAVRAGAASGEWASADIDGLLANASFTCAGTAFFGIDTTGGDFSYGTAIPNKTNMALKKLGPNKLTLTAANL